MDTTPIYELRERLRAAGIAGTNLLTEDFRLKRAYEAFKPLEPASPVFAKLGQMTAQLLSPECQNVQGALLDALTLADAVICTLGVVEIKGEVEQLHAAYEEENTGSTIVNAPCSVLRQLLEALTTSGGGHYASVCELHDSQPQLFDDYRVKYALVQALGASYAELADKVEEWLRESRDRAILPLLYHGFDPRGKKEMVRRVNLIDALAGAEANDFYLRMLEEAQKEIRQAVIFALRHDQKNVLLLMDMIKTEKGKNKDAVFMALASIEDENARACLEQAAEKQPETVLKYLINAVSSWSAELVEKICDKVLERFDRAGDPAKLDKERLNEIAIPYDLVLAMYGKSHPAIRRCYQKLLKRKERINTFLDKWREVYPYSWHCDVIDSDFWYFRKQKPIPIERGLDKILQQSLVVNPDADLCALALELDLLSAAVTAKLIGDEDCVDWLENKISTAKYPAQCMNMVVDAAAYIQWDENKNTYQIYGRALRLTHAKKFMDWLKRHASEETDRILMQWLPLHDKELCHEFGEYFYNRALQVSSGGRSYLGYMKQCGWTDCKGLGVHYIKMHPNEISSWETCYFLRDLPGGAAAIDEEYKAVCKMIDTGKIRVDARSYESFKKRMMSI